MKGALIHKKFLFSGALVLWFFSSAGAWAQMPEPSEMPAQTNSLYIAMIFHKLSNMPPDVRAWVRDTKEYRDADIFEKEDIMRDKTNELVKTYNLISPFETVTLNTTVSLSPYDPAIPGFIVGVFKDDMNFPLSYRNENFRISAQKLAAFRQIKVPEDRAEYIWRRTEKGTKARVEFQLTPLPGFDDEEEPIEAKGIMYWPPMRMKIEGIKVWSADKKEMLWKSEPEDFKSKVKRLFFRGPE
jgi:hypothetical protein